MNEQKQFSFFATWPPVETHGWEEGVKRLGMSSPIVERYGVPGMTTQQSQQLRYRRLNSPQPGEHQ